MKKINDEFASAKITGVGKFTANQLNSIESTTPNLKTGAVYLILPQIAHAQPRTLRLNDGTEREVQSNRFGALEFIGGELTGIVSVGVSALRSSHLSDDENTKPELHMELRKDGDAKGLYRPVAGQRMRVATLNNPAPLETRQFGEEKAVAMAVPFAFTVKGRKNYWSPIFKEQSDGRYDMEVDDDLNAKVQITRDYILAQTDVPNGKYDLKSYIPALADYAL